VLNGQDIVVLLKLASRDDDWTVRSLEAEIGIPRAGVHRSVQRLSAAGLYDLERRRTNRSQAEEFLVHAVKYLFPPELNGETRGIPTAWAAQPLADQLAPQSDLPPVWPDPQGRQRGIADALQSEFGAAPGDTSPDGKVSVAIARCLGSCALAPIVVVDGQLIGKTSPEAAVDRVRAVLGAPLQVPA